MSVRSKKFWQVGKLTFETTYTNSADSLSLQNTDFPIAIGSKQIMALIWLVFPMVFSGLKTYTSTNCVALAFTYF